MYLIVGLGNPENEYARTRHNMGFDVVNEITKKYNIEMNRTKFNSIYGSGTISNEKVVFVKPQTFMNLSGQAVRDFVNFYKMEIENVIIIYDDMDIEKGIMKIRKKGGPGSHNGMKSVVEELGTQDFPRVRVGIGTPLHKNDAINYVIGHVPDEEYEELKQGIDKASVAVEEIIRSGIDYAMNKLN